ncbi:MAG: hypothetical protein Q7R42_03940 [Candidatus Planktophila sp.]|nr:hypothetical protein [Candidatus Planktophila sp.]
MTKATTRKRSDTPLATYEDHLLKQVSDALSENKSVAERIISAAIQGRETKNSVDAIENWISNQLIPNTVVIDRDGYTEMCIDALKTTSTQVLTDFGTSRQRDFGQAWSDMIRGYLGEFAVTKFLEQNFALQTKLAHQRGIAETFYDSDISEVLMVGLWRKPKINVGIKTTKYNGLWLDIAKEQFAKSHLHVQVKIGGGSTHLFSFFKELSVFKDKILKVGLEGNFLTPDESEQILNDIPDFKPISAYIAGFALRDFDYLPLDYDGHMAKIHFTIHTYKGLLPRNYREQIKEREGVSAKGNVKFESINEFSSTDRFLFNTGSIMKTKSEWQAIVNQL